MNRPEFTRIRTDIQVLRGIAVLSVVLYHAKIVGTKAGYLGVDMFFVISGFLITGLIMRAIRTQRFSMVEFYVRRARRLLPAAYVTFLATLCAAPFFLLGEELVDLSSQAIGAVTFTANIVLWKQSDYFSGAAELKPLLHVWSLSVEEQFYLLVPAALVLLPRRFWLLGIGLCAVGSLMLAFAMREHMAAVFYLLPFRAWELLVGSLAAYLAGREFKLPGNGLAFWFALVSLPILLSVGIKVDGFDVGALAICVATAVIVLSNSQFLSGGMIQGVLAKLGDMSYSLYLVHWPLFAFLNNALVDARLPETVWWRVLIILVAVVLALVLRTWVEKPFLDGSVGRSVRVGVGVAASSVLLLAAAVLLPSASVSNVAAAQDLRPNYGLSPACEFTTRFSPIADCVTSPYPEVLVWGDSFAMHLVPGLASSNVPFSVAQATRSMCGPMLGMAVVDAKYSRNWAGECIDFNQSVLEYLASTDSIHTVVLSSMFRQFLNENGTVLVDVGGSRVVRMGGEDLAAIALRDTVNKVLAMGKRVVVVAPPPRSGFNIGRCLMREDSGVLMLGQTSGCDVDEHTYRYLDSGVLSLLESMGSGGRVTVVNFADLLCAKGRCATRLGGVPLYRDSGHFSHRGSELLAERYLLGRILESEPGQPGNSR